jgi:hypothetical protein
LQGIPIARTIRYGTPLLAVTLALAGAFMLQPYEFRTPLSFLAVMVSAWIGGLGPGVLAAGLAILFLNLKLNPGAASATDYQQVPNIIGLLATAFLVGMWSRARAELEIGLRARTRESNDPGPAAKDATR